MCFSTYNLSHLLKLSTYWGKLLASLWDAVTGRRGRLSDRLNRPRRCAGTAGGNTGVWQPEELTQGHEAGVWASREPPGQGQILPRGEGPGTAQRVRVGDGGKPMPGSS